MSEHEVIRWEAPEHEHIEQEPDWFWALGVVAICGAVTSILLGDFLFSLVILIAAVTVGLIAKRPPHMVQFEISDRGIRTGGTLHRYSEILGFWVEDEHDAPPLLLIDTVKFLSPNLIIPLEDVDPSVVRRTLLQHVQEVQMHEPIGHKIIRFFGF